MASALTPAERDEMLILVRRDSDHALNARVLRLLIRLNNERRGVDERAIAAASERYQIALSEVRERRARKWPQGYAS